MSSPSRIALFITVAFTLIACGAPPTTVELGKTAQFTKQTDLAATLTTELIVFRPAGTKIRHRWSVRSAEGVWGAGEIDGVPPASFDFSLGAPRRANGKPVQLRLQLETITWAGGEAEYYSFSAADYDVTF